MASASPYGKVNPMDQEKLNHQRKSKKRIIMISISAFLLVGVVVGAVVGTTVGRSKDSTDDDQKPQVSAAIKAACEVTLYPNTCIGSLSSKSNSTQQNFTPEDIFKWAVQAAVEELTSASTHFIPEASADNFTTAAFANCRELLDLALDHLNDTLSSADEITSLDSAVEDLLTWLSAAGTYQETCMDDFGDSLNDTISNYLKMSSELTSNSLAMANQFSKFVKGFNLGRRLLADNGSDDNVSSMPDWFSRKGRSLLQLNGIKADAVVAKDGSGKYKTIKDAIKAVPQKSKKRFVIYVKKGVYKENVEISKNTWNVMMIGDGMTATVVTGSRNVVDGTPTFQSATFAVKGKGFIARDMGFQNTAGSAKHQAVALMSTADQSVFYRCRMDAFQDTLYPHSNRQFYRECVITGTVDFIFGNSAVVFQNCNIIPRLPMKGQQNTITAQGKSDPNQNTGITIQGGTLTAAGDLIGKSVKTYLGRPWKNYATTVFIHTNMVGNLITPAGWLPWVGNSAPDTIFYVEYQNSGVGSSTKNRVKWKGLKLLPANQVSKFTVNSFIGGNNWLPATGVPFLQGL
ncbi:pectinesterase-like [Impatiens glandulifera]|uniref:pectinesterase-like n=1 Tax=Impatiens glandulifera TaxID=253017 RepID=UPI001FB0DE79|nr:pectinesterase-like [Impatiens glandulifera]